MDKQSINTFMLSKGRKFPEKELVNIRTKLENISYDNYTLLLGRDFKNPDISLILSILLGMYGIDRFYVGDIGLGVVKLLTGGGFVFWWIIDMCIIQKVTRKKNLKKLEKTIYLL